MAPRVLVPVADGSEDIETVTIVDVLRRAGAEVTLASVDGAWVTCAHGSRLAADCLIAACAGQTWDAIALPGGMPGAEHLRDCAALTELLHAQDAAGRTLAAICASPAVVLQHHGLLGTRRATCYPGFEHGMAGYVNARVVQDGRCITGSGPGAALEFALAVAGALFGAARANDVARAMLVLQAD